MRHFTLAAAVLSLAACGDGKALIDPGPTRYNFGIVDGANQSSVAGANQLPQPITSQLTKDPGGKFATRLKNFVLPVIAFAQGLQMPGEPVAGALVCAREAGPGEPTAFPLCAFTLGNGKAPITIKGGTKAGVHHVVFSAQVPAEEPVKDSTVVTVEAGPPTIIVINEGGSYPGRASPGVFPADMLRDQFGNLVPFRLIVDSIPTGLRSISTGQPVAGAAPKYFAHTVGDTIGTVAARTIAVDSAGPVLSAGSSPAIVVGTFRILTAQGVVATGSIQTRVSLDEQGVRTSATVGIGPLSGF